MIVSAAPAHLERDRADSIAWIAALRADGLAHMEARWSLHQLLLRASRFELTRRQAISQLRDGRLEDLARSAADASLPIVLANLDEFRGVSRFTTWASKFALREARKTAATASTNRTDQPEGHLNG